MSVYQGRGRKLNILCLTQISETMIIYPFYLSFTFICSNFVAGGGDNLFKIEKVTSGSSLMGWANRRNYLQEKVKGE